MANHALSGLVFAFAVGWPTVQLVAQPKAPDRPAAKAPAADFDRLVEIFSPPGTPSINDKKRVAVDVGPTNASASRSGWLVDDGPKVLTLLDADGDLLKFRKPGSAEKRPTLPTDKDGSMPFDRYLEADRSVAWAVRPDDFAAAAQKFLDAGVPEYKEGGPLRDLSRGRFTLQAHVVSAARLAHFARQAGDGELAAKLYARAAEAYATYLAGYGGGFEKTGELPEFVADRVASFERNGAMGAAHAGAPRADLVKRWERVAAVPGQQYRDEGRELVKAYQSLIAEDRKWVESGDDEWAVMTPDQRAAYWIYHLRDLAVGQWSDPGSCRVVDDVGAVGAGGKKPNAAAELKKLGMAAVPHLIAHLDDPRPTRCKGHWRSYWPDGHYLLRYGDCCQQVFEAVTGHTLTTETYPMQAKKGTEVKAAAEKWWRDYQAKGEKLVLIEGTAAGTRDSGGHAEMLAAKYPDAALDAIRTGARASKDGWARAALVSAAAGLTGEGVTAFLWEEADGLFPRPRVRAAAALAARGDPAGAKALVREWDRLAGETDADWSDRHFLALELVAAVAGTNDPAAVRALGVGLTDRPVEVRSTVIERLAGAGKDLRGWPLTRETADAVEDVLAGLLADREEETSASSRGDKSVRDPMLGDLAAEALAGRLGEPKLFDNTAPLQVRERQRLETKNAWLKRRGKDSVPVPARRTVVPAPDARVRPLVRAVVEAGDAAGRRAAVGVLEQLGLPALPAIRKAADGLAADHPARADLRSLAGRLALVVAETRFTDDSAKPPDAARRRVDELRGRPVTAEGFLGLLRDLSGELPEGTRGVKLTVERVGDDAGVLLLVTLVPDRPARPARPGLAPQLSYGSRVVIGEKSLGGRARRIGRAGRTEAEPGRDRLVGVRRPPADRPEGRAGRVPVRSRALRRSAVDDAGREGSVDLGINGRHAVVCASSRGLGRACALELARAGCTVVINGRDRAALDRTADEIRAETGATVIPVAADVGTPDGQAALVGAATQVDILVTNNAGPPFKDFRQVDRTALLAGVVANMAAPIELVQRVIGGMVERRFGRVVNITSGSVKMPLPGLDLSSGARAGLTAFLAEVARQVAHANVTINCLLPGAFDTRRLRSSIEAAAGRAGVDPESVAAERKSAIPAKRFGDPAEFGAACALLCSAQAGYITGQSLLIDGGAFPGTL